MRFCIGMDYQNPIQTYEILSELSNIRKYSFRAKVAIQEIHAYTAVTSNYVISLDRYFRGRRYIDTNAINTEYNQTHDESLLKFANAFKGYRIGDETSLRFIPTRVEILGYSNYVKQDNWGRTISIPTVFCNITYTLEDKATSSAPKITGKTYL